MDISPLFALRQRLHAAALAGAGSCPGDARLAQACEALAPLEAAAPVFRKLGDLVRRLRAPEGEGRAAVLPVLEQFQFETLCVSNPTAR